MRKWTRKRRRKPRKRKRKSRDLLTLTLIPRRTEDSGRRGNTGPAAGAETEGEIGPGQGAKTEGETERGMRGDTGETQVMTREREGETEAEIGETREDHRYLIDGMNN